GAVEMARAMRRDGEIHVRPLRVAVLWNGDLEWGQLVTVPKPIVLGPGPDALAPLPQRVTHADSFTVLNGDAEGYTLHPSPEMGGAISVRGDRKRLRDLQSRQRVRLGDHDFGIVTIGPLAVFFQQTTDVPKTVRQHSNLDLPLIGSQGLAAF